MKNPYAQLFREVAYSLLRCATSLDASEVVARGLLTQEEVDRLADPPEGDKKEQEEALLEALTEDVRPPSKRAALELEKASKMSPDPTINETLSEYLVRLRQLRGWHQKMAAERLGLAPGTILAAETGRNPPTTQTLQKFAAGYEVQYGTLVHLMRLNPTTPEEKK